MRRPTRWIRGAFARAALALAGAVAAWAAVPVGSAWTADPEEQFLLDVNIRQLRLGDGVRAYQTPEGTCVVFGDFLTTLDLPMKIDLEAKKASGWAFKEEHRIEIDQAAGTARYGDKQEKLVPGTIRETPEGWCVEASALGRWFKLGVKAVTAGSALLLESEAKLPVELAIERQKRAARIPARFDATGRFAATSAYPIACGARRRSTSSFTPARPIKRRPACASIATLRSSQRARLPASHMIRSCPLTKKGNPSRCGCALTARIPTVACSGPLTLLISQ